MRVGILFFVIVFLSSCYKEDTTHSEGFVTNSSGHQIRIIGFTHGLTLRGDTLDLNIGEKKKLGSNTQRGKNAIGFGSNYFSTVDSVIVTFDNQYQVVHYVNAMTILSPRGYLFSSDRNFLNPKSYYREFTEKKHTTYNIYTYNFTAADYQFAL
jgi:hypothetical protein